MEELGRAPLFKKIDQFVFESIDHFKRSPNYAMIQDLYNSLDEDQQKMLKTAIILTIFVTPMMILGGLFWYNTTVKNDYEQRVAIIKKANEIIGQKSSLAQTAPNLMSQNPIDSESMMTSRLSNVLSAIALDLSKIRVSDFSSSQISDQVLRSEAKFAFNGLSTEELMNMFTALIQRERFRVQSIEVIRNSETDLLRGEFMAIHFSSFAQEPQGE